MDVFGLAALSKVNTVGASVSNLEAAVEDLEAGSLSALTATSGQVPVADGEGSWAWGSGGTGGITDVQINGTSVVSGGVANVPVATNSVLGVVKGGVTGVKIGTGNILGQLLLDYASPNGIKNGASYYTPIVPKYQEYAAFYGLAKAAGADMASVTGETVGIYPAAQKSAISTMLTAPETVTGTTPTIAALAGVQYVCGEVSTLDITPPASGCFDVVFESGSTPTALTISNPTGTTVEWRDDFDPTNLSANAVYEINLLRMGTKYLGVAASWT